MHLTDYKVRVLDTQKGTGAVTRVLLDSTDGERSWSTIGVSENIIEASWQALVDSIVYGLLGPAAKGAIGLPRMTRGVAGSLRAWPLRNTCPSNRWTTCARTSRRRGGRTRGWRSAPVT